MDPARRTWPIYLGLLAGASIGVLDSRPHWDDTGITVGLLFLAALITGALDIKRPWLAALVVGIWVPIFDIALHGGGAALIAFVPAFLGAYAGSFAGRAFLRGRTEPPSPRD